MAVGSRALQAPRLKYLEDDFYCGQRRRRVTLQKCLTDYVDANALCLRGSACWSCPQGKINRLNWSDARDTED